MSYLVLIYVNDEEKADELVKHHSKSNSLGRAVGLYALARKDVPTCAGTCRGGWTKSETLGWDICGRCRRASTMWRPGLRRRLFSALGLNLLARADTPVMIQNPRGWGE